jgi:hypothetical protein
MEWDSNTTREQKEQIVLELHQKGKTMVEIAQLVHMSFSTGPVSTSRNDILATFAISRMLLF